MKILITGGHLTPALAVIDEIGKNAEIIFAGRKYDLDGDENLSLEYREIANKNIPFYYLQTGRFTRILNFKFIINILKIPLGFYQAFAILVKEKPDSILSFGGYIGFPICVIGYLLGTPVFIHEQTSRPGLTNKLTGFLAKKIFISFPATKKYFSSTKVVISGNPVRKTALKKIRKPFAIKKTKPVLYVTGGSLGSHSINLKIEEILPELLARYIVIHQTGKVSEYGDYQRLVTVKNTLPEELAKNYFIREHFFAEEIGSVYSQADLVIGRSGANTVFELIAWQKPAILIPLPWSANQEQQEHAGIFAKEKIGLVFDQSTKSEKLLDSIDSILKNLEVYKSNFKNVKLHYQENAAKTIVKTILQTVNHKI